MPVSRFPDGLSTADQRSVFGDFMLPDVTKAHVYFEDFDYFDAADWNIISTGSGTQALTDVDGGALAITTGGNNFDKTQLHKFGESFSFESGKKLWFEIRLKVDDLTGSGFLVGLVDFGGADGVHFISAIGAGLVRLHFRKNDVETNFDIVPLASDTFIRLGYFYNGRDMVTVFVNGTSVLSTSDFTNFPADECLTVELDIRINLSPAKTMTIDYILVAKER